MVKLLRTVLVTALAMSALMLGGSPATASSAPPAAAAPAPLDYSQCARFDASVSGWWRWKRVNLTVRNNCAIDLSFSGYQGTPIHTCQFVGKGKERSWSMPYNDWSRTVNVCGVS